MIANNLHVLVFHPRTHSHTFHSFTEHEVIQRHQDRLKAQRKLQTKDRDDLIAALVENFKIVTNANDEICRLFLEKHNYQEQDAIDDYFNTYK